jgi:lysozyme family protein
MSFFEKAFEEVIVVEGGYSNDPYDSGGKTMYGITESVAKSYGYKGEMKNLPLSTAKDIYKKNYWRSEFDTLSEDIALFLFDMNVNHGYKGMSTILQRSINLLITDDSKVIAEDGYAGKITYSKAKELNATRLYTVLNAVRAKYYVDLCLNKSTQKKFIYGWLKNRVKWNKIKI